MRTKKHPVYLLNNSTFGAVDPLLEERRWNKSRTERKKESKQVNTNGYVNADRTTRVTMVGKNSKRKQEIQKEKEGNCGI